MRIRGLTLCPLDGMMSERATDPHAAAELAWTPDLELWGPSTPCLERPALAQEQLDLAEKLSFASALETVDTIRENQAESSLPKEYLECLHRWTAQDDPTFRLGPIQGIDRSSRRDLIAQLTREPSKSPAAASVARSTRLICSFWSCGEDE